MLLPTLNITDKPIVNKYREGKLKSTLKRECKAPETCVKERKDMDRRAYDEMLKRKMEAF